MRAEWTASGACSSGSTAPPRGATRRASGGAATTSTTRAERSRGCRGGTAELEISRRHGFRATCPDELEHSRSAVGHSGGVGRGSACTAQAPRAGGTGQCRFRPASFDVSVEAESGRAGCMPDEKGRTSMGAKTEALARQFEGKARDAVATLEKLGDADWKKVTAAERWTVGVTAHHLARGAGGGGRHPERSPCREAGTQGP